MIKFKKMKILIKKNFNIKMDKINKRNNIKMNILILIQMKILNKLIIIINNDNNKLIKYH